MEGDGSGGFADEFAGDAVSVGEDECVGSGGLGLGGGLDGWKHGHGGEGNGEDGAKNAILWHGIGSLGDCVLSWGQAK